MSNGAGPSRLREAPKEVWAARSVSRPGLATWGWSLAAGAVTGALLTVRSRPDVDLWLHLRIGGLLREGTRFDGLPDPLAVLPDRRYVPTQWLAQMSMSGLYDVGGMAAIQWLRVGLVVALVGVVVLACRTVAGPTASAATAAVTAFGTSGAWGERPQLVGILLLAVTGLLWWRAVLRCRAPWAVVPLTWLWACLHGTWLIGPVVGGLFVIGAALDRRWSGRSLLSAAAVPAAALLAACFTPLGLTAVTEPFRVGEAARLYVHEWQHPTLTNPLLVAVLISVAVSLASLAVHSPDRWLRALMTVAAAALAVWMVRTIAAGAVVLAPALAMGLSALGSRRPQPALGGQRTREWQAWLLAGLIATSVGAWHAATTDWGPPVSPQVSAALSRLSPGSVLAVDGRAVGWLQLAHPDLRPLKDLRAEVYSAQTTQKYKAFSQAGPGWAAYVDEHRINTILADRHEPIDSAIAHEGTWWIAAADSRFRLWVRP